MAPIASLFVAARWLPAALLGIGLAPQALAQPSLSDSDLQVEQVVSGLSQPTTMDFLAPDDILVLQKGNGQVRRVTSGVLQAQPVLDVHVNSDSERGLLGIAINSESPPAVFLFYTEADGADGNTPLGNRVYRYDWNPGTGLLENPQLILDLPVFNGPNHDGGILVLGPPGGDGPGDGAPLYAVIGDLNRNNQLENFVSGNDPDDTAVILKVQQDGSAHPDNPFTPYCNVTTAQACSADPQCPMGEHCITEVSRYFAYGVRNSFGMALDPLTGDLWNTENGPGTYDEINRVSPGFNSGWQDIMGPSNGGSDLAGLWHVPGGGDQYSEPEFSWFDTNAPTAIVFPADTLLGPGYDTAAVVADNNAGQLYRFPLNGIRDEFDFTAFPALQDLVADNNTERDLLEIGSGFGAVTDLKIGPDGALYVVSLTFGRIHRITSSVLLAQAGADRSIAPDNDPTVLGGMPAAAGGTTAYSYSWSVTPGTEGVDYVLSANDVANPVFTGLTEQVYTAELTVDDGNDSDNDSVTITVEIPDQRHLADLSVSGDETYRACVQLSAERFTVENGAMVMMESPDVDLGDGFHVEPGGEFVVVSEVPAGCDPL